MSHVLGPLLAAALALPGAPVQAQRDITEEQPWQFDDFIADAGLKGRSILHCERDPDDRLWFASSAGLVCYDGYTWQRFGKEAGLPSEYVRCVAFTPAGECWVGTDNGAIRFDQQKGTAIPTETQLAGPSVRRIVADPKSDAVWFCCDQWPDAAVPAGLTCLRGGTWRSWSEADGLPSSYVQTMLIDSRGRHFVGTQRGLAQVVGDVVRSEFTTEGEAAAVFSLVEEADGSVLVATSRGMARFDGQRWTPLPLVSRDFRPVVVATRDGTLSVASTERRIMRVQRDTVTPASAAWGVRSNGIEHALEDVHGAVWLVGHNELRRWRRGGEWHLFADCPTPVLTDGDGVLWSVGRQNTFTYSDGRWEAVGPATRQLCIGPDGAVWGIQPDQIVRWSPADRRRVEIVATGVDHPLWLAPMRSVMLVVGIDGDGGGRVAVGRDGHWDPCPPATAFDARAVIQVATGGADEAWLLAGTASSGCELYHVAAATMRRLPLPAAELRPGLPRLAVSDSGTNLCLYGLFGLYLWRDATWTRIETLPGRHVQLVRALPHRMALVTRSTSGGVGGITLAPEGADPTAWRNVRIDAEVFLGVDNRGRLLLADERLVTRIAQDKPVSPLQLPLALDNRSAVPGEGDELWFTSGDTGQVLRYRPDGVPPRVHVHWMDTSITEGERVALAIDLVEFQKPRSASTNGVVHVELDGQPYRTLSLDERPLLLAGLDLGEHQIALRAEDESGDLAPSYLVGKVEVRAPPLQEQPWFWPAVALAMLALLLLAAHAWRTSRRLARQTRSLETTVAQRTAELRARDEILLHAQKMEAVGRLAGGVAHDFNNLLTVILGNLDLTRRALHPSEDADALDSLAQVEDASRRARELTRQLLAFSRADRTGAGPTDIVDHVRTTANLLRRLVPAGVAIEVDAPDQTLPVAATRADLEQVVANLVVNAADAMAAGGRVRIVIAPCHATRPGTDSPQRFVCVEVIDNGAGMDRETAARAFDPYFTTKPHERGTGLGLAIVHGVLTRLGGFVELESTLGVGTRVRSYFPSSEAVTETIRPDPAASPQGEGRTVLLCEDEPALLQLARRTLESAGYRVLASVSVRGALELEANHPGPIAAVITDIVTRERSGIELAQDLERRRPGVPVLMISGFPDDVLQQHGIDRTAVRLLEKPFDPGDLLRAVADTIRSAVRA